MTKRLEVKKEEVSKEEVSYISQTSEKLRNLFLGGGCRPGKEEGKR